MAYREENHFDLRGFFNIFFAFYGGKFETLDCSMWSRYRERHLPSSGFLLYIKELNFNELRGVSATLFVRFETSKSNHERQIFEITADPLTIEKEEDYLKLLDDRLATLCNQFRNIVEV